MTSVRIPPMVSAGPRSRPAAHPPTARALPAWPFTALFLLFPLWWALGVVDLVIIPIAVVMAAYLALVHPVRVPKGFGIWVTFLVLMLCSVIELTAPSQYLTFSYRAAIYLSSAVVLVYVYNARAALPDRRVLGHLTVYWVTVVAGGYLGMAAPTGSLRTPMYELLSKVAPGLLSNGLVKFMVIRQFSQYDPNGYFQIPPRPAAPFLYTNEWGNIYSLLVPLVLAFLVATRRRSALRRALIVLLPISAVPAMLTTNRGMMVGLGIALVYVVVRLAVRLKFRTISILGLLGLIGVALWFILPLQEALSARSGASTPTRASLYEQALHAAAASPVFGYGVPIGSTNPIDPPVGTQGQFWMVLVSHGVLALICFIGFFVAVVIRSMHRTDPVGLACNTVILVGVVELFFYGVVPYGLPVMMCVAALALRPRPVALRQAQNPADARSRSAVPSRRRTPERR